MKITKSYLRQLIRESLEESNGHPRDMHPSEPFGDDTSDELEHIHKTLDEDVKNAYEDLKTEIVKISRGKAEFRTQSMLTKIINLGRALELEDPNSR